MSPRFIIRAVNTFLVILWPTLTFAASSTFGTTFQGVGWAAWLMVIVLSTVAGMTALLNRIAKELQNDGTQPHIPSLRLFIASNLFGSWLTGLFFFLVCEHFDVPDFLEAAAVIGASYAGARLIERAMEGVVDKAIDRVGILFGAAPRGRYDEPSTGPRSRYDDAPSSRFDSRPSRFDEQRDGDRR